MKKKVYLSVDGLPLVGGDGTPLVNGITDHVDDTAEGLGTHGDHDGRTGVVNHLSTDQTLSTVHGDGTHGVLSEMLGNLERENEFYLLNHFILYLMEYPSY